MAFQFPINPTVGQTAVNQSSNLTYTWTGTFWSTQPVTASRAITSSFATTASYYATRLNIEDVTKNGTNGALFLVEGRVFMTRGGGAGLDFNPFGLSSGSTYTEFGIGLPNTTEIPFPEEIAGTCVDVGTYGNSAYALFANGDLYTWGENQFGELGIGNTTNRFYPTLATTDVAEVYKPVNSVSSLFWYGRLFIRKINGKVFGTGYNGQGALGLGDVITRNTFTEITALGLNPIGVWSINGYDGWTIAQKANGDVVACGAGGTGNLGNGAAGNYTSFQLANGWKNGRPNAIIKKVRGSANWSSGGGANYSANMSVWIQDGALNYVMFSGNNTWGNSGNGNTTNVTSPVAATLPTTFVDFERTGPSAGFCYALLADGTVRAWGYNSNGQLGYGTTLQNNPTPTQVFTSASAFFAGDINYPDYNLQTPSVIIKRSDNSYWICGPNPYGYLGVGDFTQKLVFTRIKFPSDFTAKHISAFASRGDGGIGIAVSTENKIYAWGHNADATIVDSVTNNNIPVPILILPPALIR